MKVYLVNFNRESDTADWRVYEQLRNARAAVTLAMKQRSQWHDDAEGAEIFEVDTEDLTSLEQHGSVGSVQIDGQQELF